MNIEILDRVKHASLKYHKDELPTMPFVQVLANELADCSDNFCVVFTNGEKPNLVALLGQTKNDLIDENYKGYVPASLQNYPFLLTLSGENSVLCVDTDAPHLKGKGEALFTKGGKDSDFTKKLANVMKNYDEALRRTLIAIEEIKKTGILESKELYIEKDGVKTTLIEGFCIVNREKLFALDDKTLADFARRGYLELIFMHLKSLSNFRNLTEKIIQNLEKDSK